MRILLENKEREIRIRVEKALPFDEFDACLLARRFVFTLQPLLLIEETTRYITIAIAYQPDSTECSPITFGFGSEHDRTIATTVIAVESLA